MAGCHRICMECTCRNHRTCEWRWDEKERSASFPSQERPENHQQFSSFSGNGWGPGEPKSLIPGASRLGPVTAAQLYRWPVCRNSAGPGAGGCVLGSGCWMSGIGHLPKLSFATGISCNGFHHITSIDSRFQIQNVKCYLKPIHHWFITIYHG